MALAIAFAAVGGLIVGSFLNVVIHRLPRGESLTHPRSRCPSCGTQLRAIDNVPVVSWLPPGRRGRPPRAPRSARRREPKAAGGRSCPQLRRRSSTLTPSGILVPDPPTRGWLDLAGWRIFA